MKFLMPKGCEGLRMEVEKTLYASKPGGSVEVDNPRHIKYILNSDQWKEGHIGGGAAVHLASDSDRYCDCGLALWPWQTQCSRCVALSNA